MIFLSQLIADLAFYLPKWLPVFYFAALNTLQMVGWSMLLALSLGLLLALGRRSDRRVLHWSCAAYVDFMRGIPAFAFLYFVYYGLPALALSVGTRASARNDSSFVARARSITSPSRDNTLIGRLTEIVPDSIRPVSTRPRLARMCWVCAS